MTGRCARRLSMAIAEHLRPASPEMMNTSLSWDHVRSFLTVFEEGSLSAAARVLGLAQPTVRGHVRGIEHALGTVLFTRSVAGLVPTEAAHALVPHARTMSLAATALARAASAPPGEIAGSVRLSVSEFVGIEVVPPILAALRKRHPGLVVELSLSNASADLLGQEADVAIRMTEPRQGAIVARRVGAIPLGFFAHRDYVARRGSPGTLDAMAGHDVIGPDRSTADLSFAADIDPALTRDRFALRTDSHPAQLAAARAGMGIAVVQVPIGAADPDLMRILPDRELGRLPVWITMHEDLRAVPRVRALFDHLVDAFDAMSVSAGRAAAKR